MLWKFDSAVPFNHSKRHNGTRIKASNGSLDSFLLSGSHGRIQNRERTRTTGRPVASVLRFPEIKRSMALWVIRWTARTGRKKETDRETEAVVPRNKRKKKSGNIYNKYPSYIYFIFLLWSVNKCIHRLTTIRKRFSYENIQSVSVPFYTDCYLCWRN